MSAVDIQNLSKTFSAASRPALDDVSLVIEAGEMLVLLGPSGCGKTTILRSLAGLEQPTKGTITIGGTRVYDATSRTDLAPDRRNVGMVFQSYGLWPHMTVLENIRFPLSARKNAEGLKGRWAEQMADLVSCSHLLDRYPGELSGGQQQRIALARALVARPSLMLFDEPLSNLDARLRSDLRTAIRELHRQFEFTGAYVTHDQEEGLTVGDRILVMNEGQIVQTGTPGDVHRDPATSWVADFMGMTNEVRLDTTAVAGLDSGSLRFRPEDGRLSAVDSEIESGDAIVRLPSAFVVDRAFSGNFSEFTLEFGGSRLRVRLESRAAADLPDAGGVVDISIPARDLRAYDSSGFLASPLLARA